MSCREIADFLARYLEAELSEAERARFEAHLEICPPCVAYLESYRATLTAARAAFDDRELPCGVPQELVEAILASREAASRD